jgi:hypothetical protein
MQRAGLQTADTTVQDGEITKQAEERTHMMHDYTTPLSEDYLASVIVPRATSTRDITVLETAMQALALDKKHPVALELAATDSSRYFLLRATSAMSLAHLIDQVQARYPQAIIHPISKPDDPLLLQEGETVSAIELHAGAAAYLPLRAIRERELLQEGADPLLGILGVFNHLPPRMRVVTQLALVPASPTWSQGYRRKSVEHPLEQERLRARSELSGAHVSSPSTFRFVGMGVLIAVLLVWWRLKRQLDALIPSWLLQAGVSLLHGKTPQFSSAHLVTLEIGGSIALAALFCLAFFVLQVRNHLMKTPMYDMRLVDEKTARSAYRVRLRLFVFSDEARRASTLPVPLVSQTHHTRPSERGIPYFSTPSFPWSSLGDAYQQWRIRAQRTKYLKQEQRDVLDHLVATYRQYHTAAGGYFVSRRLSQGKAQRLLRRQTGWMHSRWTGWEHDLATSSHLLSVADIASLWHLPQTQDLFDLPYVERARARTALAPSALTRENGWKIGTSSHVGHCVPVFLPEECLRHNLLAVASTGKGKSTLFQHLAQAVCALRASSGSTGGPGLAFIEPHGDVVHALCGLFPASERDNVVLVDLANTEYPVGINPLDMVGKDRDKVVDTLITIAEHLWAASYGSRTENVLEYALKTLADANELLIQHDPYLGPDRQYTLLDVVPLLRLASFRHVVLEQVRDSLLLDWWQHYYEPLDAHQQREITSSVITKLSKFSSSRVARRILGQPRSTIDLREVVRSGQLLLVSTASGVVGSDLSELIGIVLLGLFEAALSEQADQSPEQRRRYLVLIDEFQVYRGANYQGMLAELRKYGGSFALATQSLAYLDRLDRTLRATVLANIDHLFAFHMAGEDARLLHELDGVTEEDITNLDDFQCYAKLSLHGRRLPVFSLQLDAPLWPDENVARLLRLRNQARYGRPVGVVDDLIRHIQARQKSATQTIRRVPRRIEGEETATGNVRSGEEVGRSRRHKKRGGSNRNKQQEGVVPSHLHLMYSEDDESESSRTQEDDESDAPDA